MVVKGISAFQCLTIGVLDNLDDLSLTACSDLTVQPLDEVNPTAEKLPPPTFVTNAVGPEIITSKRRKRCGRVTHEAADGMRVHAKEERNEQMVSVPERLERLLSDLCVRRCVHQQHAQQHDVAGDSTSLGIVDLQSKLGTDLAFLDVVEAI